MSAIDQINQGGTTYEIVPEIAELFSIEKTYRAGDHVIYEAGWYTFKADKYAGAWDATKVDGPFKVTNQISELKEDFTQMESDGVVPSAEQILTDKGVTDSVPYHYRKTGGDGADRLYDQIVGGTVCWNQIFPKRSVNYSGNGYTITSNNDGEFTVNVTSDTATQDAAVNHTDLVLPYTNHVYAILDNSSLVTVSLKGVVKNSNTIFKSGDTRYNNVVFIFENLAQGTYKVHPQLFDLTAMFGSTIADYIYQLEQTTAGAGVAFFKNLFPNDYYPYDSGTLKSVEGLSEHKMVGFNQWDEEWEVGGIDSNTGAYIPNANGIRAKNYINVIPNSTYYVNTPKEVVVWGYDGSFVAVRRLKWGVSGTIDTTGIKYIRFATTASGYGTTYNHDICINISDPAKNGTYESYKSHIYPLDSTVELRGMFKLDANNKIYADGDVYSADGTVTRKYGIVDLGTLTWQAGASTVSFYANKLSDEKVFTNDALANWICQKFKVVIGNSFSSETSAITSLNGGNIYIKDPSFDGMTAAQVKTAMSGVYLVYELAEPTTESADPYQHLQQCDPNGTEEYVSTGIVPVGHNTKYPENLKAKIEGLPWNFASLIAPTESTYTATRNYTTGALFIVDNVLYKATSNIANGGAITPNTNCTATTLAEIISALA